MTISIVSAVLLSMVYLSRALSAKSLARDFGRSTKKLRVAVIGAGVASCSAANTLATFQNDDGDFPFHVSLFDSGRGAGGRCSTRRSKQDGVDLQFDHGAVYIGKPKTEEFSATLEDWKESGAVKEWIGSFADLRFKNTFGSFVRGTDTGRYVGVPTMSEICKSMLDPYENIEQYYQSTVKPLVVSEDNHRGRWKIVTEKDGESEEVGDAYDWVVIGDKKEVTSELLGSSSSLVQQMPFKSAPVLAVMAAFSTDEVLRKFPYDGVRLDGHPVLGWMSRETSKPWRERTDGKELWLLQSTVDFAQHIIHSVGNKGDPQEIKLSVASAAERPLLDAFCSVVKHELQLTQGIDVEVPGPIFLRGHRWGAAFPASFVQGTEREGGRSYVDPSRCIAVVGDYFGTAAEGGARIEGACLSGISAARGIIESSKATGKLSAHRHHR